MAALGVSGAPLAKCKMCTKPLGDGEGHWCGDNAQARALGKICDSCQTAMQARYENTDPRLEFMWRRIRGARLLPGFSIPPPPADLEVKRKKLFRFIGAYAKSRGMVAKCADDHVTTFEDWFRVCYKQLQKKKHHNKIYVVRWNFDKPWCVDKTNQELCQRNPELLQCHWAAYHKDSYVRGSLFNSVDSCIESFTHFMENLAGKAMQDCPICMETMLSDRRCSTCKQPVCIVCLSKVDKCPFCRADTMERRLPTEDDSTSKASEPSYAEVTRALAESGVKAVVWTSTQVIKLDFKPVLPGQFKRAFERAGVAVCDAEGQWLYETRLLGMGPSVYALGAKDGHEEVWANNTDEVCSASVYLRETAGVQEIIKSAVVVYYE